jgi:hypothetical protein
MRRLAVIALAAFTMLSLAGSHSAAAAHWVLNGCHLGYSNNCKYSSCSECLQDNIWAGPLGLCTRASPPLTYRSRRAHL